MQKTFGLLVCYFSLTFILSQGPAWSANIPAAPLPTDPLITEGVLPNGMHYVIRPNKTPDGQVSIWLHIGTGSINETEPERGLAHYLEHMAFDGTEHFPPGAMTQKLRGMGLTVGVHQNAFTSFDQTTFQLNLPNVTPESIKTALLCLSDIAYRMTVPADQIEKEKKIVLEELRARSGPKQRTMKQTLSTLFAASTLGDRDVIGTEATIKSFTREEVLDFYHRGYQPEKATLIIVGDIQPADLAKLIPTYFANWQSSSPGKVASSETVPAFTKHEQVITDPELSAANVSLYSLAPPQPLTTEAGFRSSLVARLTDWIIATRLETMVQKGGAPFQRSDVEPGNFQNFCYLNTATLAGDPRKWREMLKVFATECHRVELYGFSNQEIADARAAVLAENKRLAQTLETRDSIEIMHELNRALSEKSALVSDADLLVLAEKQLPTITAAELEEHFKTTFDPAKWLTIVTLPGKTASQPADGEIQSIITSAHANPVQPLAPYLEKNSILDHEPEPPATSPTIVQHDASLDVTSATLANSVVVNHHAMSSTKNEVHLKLTLPGGEIAETAANRGITQLVAACLNQTATSRLSSVEMKRILNGKNIEFYAGADLDALTLNIITTSEDLEDAFRLLHAVLISAQLENSAAENWREMMLQQLEAEKSNVAATEMWALRQELYSGDLRRSQVPMENINRLKLDEAQNWADHLLQKSPVEIGIVGDVSKQQALNLANKYLGSLSQRPVMKDTFVSERQLVIKSGSLSRLVETPTITNKAMVSIGYRGASIKDRDDVNGLQIIGYMVQNRIRQKVREEQGLTYTASILSQPGDAYPAAGLFLINLTCDPAKTSQVTQLCQQIVDDFVKKGFTQEELDEATQQYANALKTREYNPDYWLDRLARLKYSGWNLDWMKEGKVVQLENMKMIRSIAAKHLIPANRITVMSSPAKEA